MYEVDCDLPVAQTTRNSKRSISGRVVWSENLINNCIAELKEKGVEFCSERFGAGCETRCLRFGKNPKRYDNAFGPVCSARRVELVVP